MAAHENRPARRADITRVLTSLALTAAAAAALVALGAAPAQAHPLGNFTINHYDGLTLLPDRVTDLAVVDRAEIPTLQARDTIDTDHDGVLEPAELAAAAATQCSTLVGSVTLTADGSPLHWTVTDSALELRPGAAGLPTSRLTCALTVNAQLDRPTRISISDLLNADHIGWREITATGRGVHVEHSPVPVRSVSDQLRHYPNDLLSAPLDVHSAVLDVAPGEGAAPGAAPVLPTAGLADRVLSRVTGVFDGLVGSTHLTLGVGVLALLLSLILGASHAAMPGHGKTVMAAYLAGKNGSVRDAVTVGTTVTLTHTAGVLILGLLVSVSATLTGESVLNWLGAASGLLIAAIGISLLRGVRRTAAGPPHAHDHEEHGHRHEHGRDNHHPRNNRRTLIGMGIAGGLVPSPSATVVLLGAVALGRTAFGIALVLGYGVGMAATLTAAGLVLVRINSSTRHALANRAVNARLLSYTPLATALLVFTVGVGLAFRSLAPLI